MELSRTVSTILIPIFLAMKTMDSTTAKIIHRVFRVSVQITDLTPPRIV